MIKVIAFDGDDTLWHNEMMFSVTQQRFRDMLVGYVPGHSVDEPLFATEMRNLRYFGYGVKGFVLSMIETAIEVTDGAIAAADIQGLIDAGKWMIEHPVELLDGVQETLERLAPGHRLVLVTKGDLFDQESKVARSGLGPLFERVEIVSDKTPEVYRRVLSAAGVDPVEFLMVGNSLRSDVLPVAAVGGHAVHIPYHITWQHEVVEPRADANELVHELRSMTELPDLIARLA